MSALPRPYPVDDLFSRQDVQVRTGVPADVLAYWIKQGLIIPRPAGPRAHRRFGFEQLHVAAILNAMRSLGANVGVLRKFAEGLQSGMRILSEADDRFKLYAATTLSLQLDRFHQGYVCKVYDPSCDPADEQIASTEAEIVNEWLHIFEAEGANRDLVSFAKGLSPYEARGTEWALWLTDPSHIEQALDATENCIAWLDLDGQPHFVPSNATVLGGEHGPPAAFYIPVRLLIARLWPDRIQDARRSYESRREERTLQRIHELQSSDPSEAGRLQKWLERVRSPNAVEVGKEGAVDG